MANAFVKDEDILSLIDEAPAAYDVDKVVEQMSRVLAYNPKQQVTEFERCDVLNRRELN